MVVLGAQRQVGPKVNNSRPVSCFAISCDLYFPAQSVLLRQSLPAGMLRFT